MSLYDRLASTVEGARALAAARLRRDVLGILHKSLEESGLTQTELAKKLGVRRSAVNQVFRGDGNVRINTLAEYLHALGFELNVQLVETGELRRAVVEQRIPRPAFPSEALSSPWTIWHTFGTGKAHSLFARMLASAEAVSAGEPATLTSVAHTWNLRVEGQSESPVDVPDEDDFISLHRRQLICG
jgi:transcriptional regulator with XRE-family HTH domain